MQTAYDFYLHLYEYHLSLFALNVICTLYLFAYGAHGIQHYFTVIALVQK